MLSHAAALRLLKKRNFKTRKRGTDYPSLTRRVMICWCQEQFHFTKLNLPINSTRAQVDPVMNNPEPESLPSLSSSLLVRVQEMQPDAWARMVDVFSPIVYRWARQAGLSGTDSADVVQEVFTSIARRVGSFQRQKDKGSFRSWLATITRNRIRDVFRRKQKQPDGHGGSTAMQNMMRVASPESDAWEESISVAALESRLPQRVLEMIRAQCDEKTWQAFWMTTIEEQPASVVAESLGLNVASVYQAKTRTLRKLRKRMEELP